MIGNSHQVYFKIQNCSITDAQGGVSTYGGAYGAAIELINCSRGIIYNNTCRLTSSQACGILLEDYNCYNITIERNLLRSSNRYGILTYGAYDIYILHDNASNCYRGIYLYDGTINCAIENNNATNNQNYGIYLNTGCNNNTIIGNNVSNNHDGIYLYSSDNNTIQGNIANDNVDEGIDLNRYCDNNRVLGNIANNNTSEGIQLYQTSHFNII